MNKHGSARFYHEKRLHNNSRVVWKQSKIEERAESVSQTATTATLEAMGKIKQRVYFINSAFITLTHTHNCYLWQNDSYATCILKSQSAYTLIRCLVHRHHCRFCVQVAERPNNWLNDWLMEACAYATERNGVWYDHLAGKVLGNDFILPWHLFER